MQYKSLSQNKFELNAYSLVPIRDKDKYAIMQWRNEQINILRQTKPLTVGEQENYFTEVVNKLFEEEQPSQLLFSFLENDQLIGYGGLVHINWQLKQAEISFLTETKRSEDKVQFISDWQNYLTLIKQVAGEGLHFNKIFTYAYDLRPALYSALANSGFREEQRIKDAIQINEKKVDVLIHHYVFTNLNIRKATEIDLMHYFIWANDDEVRKNSFNQDKISLETHSKWYIGKIHDLQNYFYIFEDDFKQAIGQVRIEIKDAETIIGITLDKAFRGLSLSAGMLDEACKKFRSENKQKVITAYIKIANQPSYKAFLKAGFTLKDEVSIGNIKSYKMIYE